jgi:hypothetical protein
VRRASGYCCVIEISLIERKRHDKTLVAGYERAKMNFKDAIRICVRMCIYEGWNFNSGNYLFTTDTK